jgi:hypothetical protein
MGSYVHVSLCVFLTCRSSCFPSPFPPLPPQQLITQMLAIFLYKAVRAGTRGNLFTTEYKRAWKW